MTTAFYPGSFDPITNGHVDVLVQALNVAEKVIVAIGIHPGKAPLFSFEERAELIRRSLAEALPGKTGDISVVAFDNLVVDAARTHGATLLIRGLRDGTDLDYEMQMAGMNRTMAPDIQTIFCRRARPRGPLPPHWSARSPPWAAMSALSCRPPSCKPSHPSAQTSKRKD